MYLLLQFLFNRFEIIQGSFIGYEYDACMFFNVRTVLRYVAIFENADILVLYIPA